MKVSIGTNPIVQANVQFTINFAVIFVFDKNNLYLGMILQIKSIQRASVNRWHDLLHRDTRFLIAGLPFLIQLTMKRLKSA